MFVVHLLFYFIAASFLAYVPLMLTVLIRDYYSGVLYSLFLRTVSRRGGHPKLSAQLLFSSPVAMLRKT